MVEPTSFRSLVDWFARHPLVGLVGTIASVLGVLLSIWFFLATFPARDLILIEPAVRSVFVNKDAPAVLTVRVCGSDIVHQDVFAVQFAVWNHGNQSMRPENTLAPFKLTPAAGNRVVDAQVLRKSRDVCGIAVHVEDDGASTLMDWRILEPDDGAVIQLVIVGDRDCAIRASGIVEGGKLKYLRVAPSTDKGSQGLSFPTKDWVGDLLVLAFGLAFACGAFQCLIRDLPKAWRRRNTARGRANVRKEITGGVLCLAFVCGIGYVLIANALYSYPVPERVLRGKPLAVTAPQ